MKQREINLIDLLFVVLLKWRMIFVAMLVGAVLLSGFSYWQSVKSINLQQVQNELKQNEKKETNEMILMLLE